MNERQERDALYGMAWWNRLTEEERTRWMERAGNTGIASDAWEAYKRSGEEHPADTCERLGITLD